jgi:hypothetical protein
VGFENVAILEKPDWNMLPQVENLPAMYQMDRGDDCL